MEPVELLMPAGSLEKLKYAFAYGADAVYAGVPLFSLRARENEFNEEDLREGLALARAQNKKVYLTANIFGRNLKLKSFQEHLVRWAELKPHAMIMSDPGLIMMVREKYPEIQVHLSVQANCMNWQSVKFWQQMGVTRIILSRELRLEEIKEIRQRVPDIELESFVHGSICIAYSGRCLLSHYMSHRDANQGVCDNTCRYSFGVHKAESPKPDEEFYLEDLRDKGKFYQIDEDEHGTYIMNAKDLCSIEYLKQMKDAGVCSFKVEGRTKSVYYAAMISKIYRRAIDDMEAGRPFDPSLWDELHKIAHRGYHPGFIAGSPDHSGQNYDHSVSRHYTQSFAGLGEQFDPATQELAFEVRAQLRVGAEVEVIGPKTSYLTTVQELYNGRHERVDVVHPGTGRAYIRLPQDPGNMPLLSVKKTEPVKETIIVQSDLVQALNSQIQAADASLPLGPM